jgi:hypothetical protein
LNVILIKQIRKFIVDSGKLVLHCWRR